VIASLLFAHPIGPRPAGGETELPPGFAAQVYVSGEGYGAVGTGGLPPVTTLGVDPAGYLYMARPGRRYLAGEIDDLWPIYRIPPGGTRLTPRVESAFFYGPSLPSAQIAAVHDRELLVTTYDRDRKIGVLYRLRDGRAELVAGGSPAPGEAPVLVQPEGADVDVSGNIYVADRARNSVVKLDAEGRVLDPKFLSLVRPRLVAGGPGGVWIVSDGTAEAPWQKGTGDFVHVGASGTPRVVVRRQAPAAIAVSPTGHLFVADRHAAKLVVLDPEGRALEFATFTESDAPRALAWAPVATETSRAGLAGDLFVSVIRRGAFQSNVVLRISGPFETWLRERYSAASR
jgi:hypothetical protein